MSTQQDGIEVPAYTVLCPSNISTDTPEPCQTDPVASSYGTILHDSNTLTRNNEQRISEIFDHPYNTLIRGRRQDIKPLNQQKLTIAHHDRFVKRWTNCTFCTSTIVLIISTIFLILIQPMDHNGPDSDIMYGILMTITIIGLLTGLFGCAVAYKGIRFNIDGLWNQTREIRLFRIDLETNHIHYMIYSYDYGKYPNVHEPIIRNIQNIEICKIDQLIYIAKKIGKASYMEQWIELQYRDDMGRLQKYRYTFKQPEYWRKFENRASYGDHLPNPMRTYQQFKASMDTARPGWQNPTTYLSTIV